MDIVTQIFRILGRIPAWIWLLVLACIVLPSVLYIFKRSSKVLAIVIGFIACCFIFPSIVSSFMQRAGLTYDDTTGILTNRDGQQIQILLPEDGEAPSEEQLQNIMQQLKEHGISIEELMKNAATEDLAKQLQEIQQQTEELEEHIDNTQQDDAVSLDSLMENATP